MKEKLTKKQMTNIFKELVLYYSQPYINYDKKQLEIVMGIYYESLKTYSEDVIRVRMRKYIESERYFPKVCDLIPTESDFMEVSRMDYE